MQTFYEAWHPRGKAPDWQLRQLQVMVDILGWVKDPGKPTGNMDFKSAAEMVVLFLTWALELGLNDPLASRAHRFSHIEICSVIAKLPDSWWSCAVTICDAFINGQHP